MSSYWENCIGFAICLKNGKFTANLRQTYTSFLRRKNEANERHISKKTKWVQHRKKCILPHVKYYLFPSQAIFFYLLASLIFQD